MKPFISILGVDDRPANLLALEAVLEPLGINFVKADSGNRALEFVLEQDFALILMDVQMPGMDGFETASLIRTNKNCEHIPIIFVTAISFEDKHVFRGYDAGAVDYLFKPIDPNILVSKVKVFIELFKQKQKAESRAHELKKANLSILEHQKALKQSEIRFRTAFDQSFQYMAILDIQGRVLEVNDLAARQFFNETETYVDKYIWDICPQTDPEGKNQLQMTIKTVANGQVFNDEITVIDRNGEENTILRTISPVKDEAGNVTYIVLQGQDITSRKQAEQDKLKLEAQLRQAQKMEALGTLAGGIAHDFNNILSVILGYADMARAESSDNSIQKKHMLKIISAADKAKDLVRQILGFSRQTEFKQVCFKPALIMEEVMKLLRVTIPVTIDFRLNIDRTCGSIYADPTQFHQIMINLCTNAYHAMEYQDGILDIMLKETKITQSDLQPNFTLPSGRYAQITIKDNGMGMDDKTLDRIFDPYFTTKEVGKGTGMGLAIVHGIVKNHGGHICVQSRLNEGSAFTVYFPIIDNESEHSTKKNSAPVKGNEHILLIDDEIDFLDMTKAMIENLGYTVTTKQNNLDALELFTADPHQFDLVMTDYAMPGMSGIQLAKKILEQRNGMPIILLTGYGPEITKRRLSDLGIQRLLFKPLDFNELSMAMRECLDNQPARQSVFS